MLDLRDRALAEVARADDFIVSDRLISLMIARCRIEAPQRRLQDLLDPEGSEIYLKPAGDYVALGEAVPFAAVIEAARRGEIAFGYRIAATARTRRQRTACRSTRPRPRRRRSRPPTASSCWPRTEARACASSLCLALSASKSCESVLPRFRRRTGRPRGGARIGLEARSAWIGPHRMGRDAVAPGARSRPRLASDGTSRRVMASHPPSPAHRCSATGVDRVQGREPVTCRTGRRSGAEWPRRAGSGSAAGHVRLDADDEGDLEHE